MRQARSPGFIRRLAASLYDLLLLFGVLMIAVAIVIIPYDLATGNPFPHEELYHAILLQLYLAGTIGLYFLYFWVRGGQTLGMRAWQFRLMREDGSGLERSDALARLAWAAVCLAPAGAGFLWMLLDRERLTCYDRLSRTRPVMLKE